MIDQSAPLCRLSFYAEVEARPGAPLHEINDALGIRIEDVEDRFDAFDEFQGDLLCCNALIPQPLAEQAFEQGIVEWSSQDGQYRITIEYEAD